MHNQINCFVPWIFWFPKLNNDITIWKSHCWKDQKWLEPRSCGWKTQREMWELCVVVVVCFWSLQYDNVCFACKVMEIIYNPMMPNVMVRRIIPQWINLFQKDVSPPLNLSVQKLSMFNSMLIISLLKGSWGQHFFQP